MFTGLTVATMLGVPFGTWLGLHFGWRATFWAVTLIGVVALAVHRALRAARPCRERKRRRRCATISRCWPRPQVLLGLAMTVLGFAGVFAVFTYIQPILTEITGFSEAAVSPILLRLRRRPRRRQSARRQAGRPRADAAPCSARWSALARRARPDDLRASTASVTAVIFVGLLGAAAFATVAPLQMRVLEKAGGAGQSLASSLNIAAFNLGNALGAWLGGVVIDHGPGLGALGWSPRCCTLAGLAVALWSRALDRRDATRRLRRPRAA